MYFKIPVQLPCFTKTNLLALIMKNSSFHIAVPRAYSLFNSCEKNDNDVGCSSYDYSDCNTIGRVWQCSCKTLD